MRERLRLFYVGITRAKKDLFVSYFKRERFTFVFGVSTASHR